MNYNQDSTHPELNIKYNYQEELFDTEDMIKVFDKIYELKYDRDLSETDKFNELLEWISEGSLIYKYSR